MARRARWRSRARAFFSSLLAGRPPARAAGGGQAEYRSIELARPRMHVPFFSTVHASPARARIRPCAWTWKLAGRLAIGVWFGLLEADSRQVLPCKSFSCFFIFLSISGTSMISCHKAEFQFYLQLPPSVLIYS
jgi:hypothetical protein